MSGSTVVITYDGTPIDSALVQGASFESQMAAMPGQFSLTVKDVDQSLVFTTGKELTLEIDGQRLWGGYVLNISKTYAFSSDDTTSPSSVGSRQWKLSGSDYNILFDTRVLRNPDGYTKQIPEIPGPTTESGVISYMHDYFDIDDIDVTSEVEAVTTMSGGYPWMTQGTKWRDVMDNLGQWGGIYYIDAYKKLHFFGVQNSFAPWGLSDKPNHQPVGWTGGTPTIGFRDGEYIEDGTQITNDALVWGGSQWANDGAVVFARRYNADSIAEYGRWQTAENHVGEGDMYNVESGVIARANVIVDGSTSGSSGGITKGRVYPDRQFKATWFSMDVPKVGGVPVHLVPGYVVPIELYVFSEDGGVTPYTQNVPLRQASITFPALAPDGTAYVQFDGSFGVQMSDPYWLWAYLRSLAGASTVQRTAVETADNTTVSPSYGAQYQDVPSPLPDGTTTVFSIPFAYVPYTLEVEVNGIAQIGNSGYTETNPAAGTFTMTFIPRTTDKLLVRATLAG